MSKVTVEISLDADELEVLKQANLVQDTTDVDNVRNGLYCLIYNKIEELQNFDI